MACSLTIVGIVPFWLHDPVIPSYLFKIHSQGVSATLSLASITVDLSASASPLSWLPHSQYNINPVFISVGYGYRFGVHFASWACYYKPMVCTGPSYPSSNLMSHVEMDPAPLDFSLVSVESGFVSFGGVESACPVRTLRACGFGWILGPGVCRSTVRPSLWVQGWCSLGSWNGNILMVWKFCMLILKEQERNRLLVHAGFGLLSAKFGWLCDGPHQKHAKCTQNSLKKHRLILRHIMHDVLHLADLATVSKRCFIIFNASSSTRWFHDIYIIFITSAVSCYTYQRNE